jgi:hypothetical protein
MTKEMKNQDCAEYIMMMQRYNINNINNDGGFDPPFFMISGRENPQFQPWDESPPLNMFLK